MCYLVHLQILNGYLFKLIIFYELLYLLYVYCIYPDDNDNIILITIYFRIKTFETWEMGGDMLSWK